MYEEFIAERISSLRAQKNVSAREMSLALGQNSSYINRIENQKVFPSMQVFFYICEYLHITPKDFFDMDIKNPKILNDVIQELRLLDNDQLALIYSLIKQMNKHK